MKLKNLAELIIARNKIDKKIDSIIRARKLVN